MSQEMEVEPFSKGIYATFTDSSIRIFSAEHDGFVKRGFVKRWDGMAATQVLGPHRSPKLTIQAEIDAYRVRSLENFVEREVRVMFAEPEILPRMQKTGQPISMFKLYTYSSGSVPLAMVEHNLRTKKNTALCKGRWVSVDVCMAMLKPRLTYSKREQIVGTDEEDQQNWWAANGKVFPLLRVAAELRNDIYRAALGNRIWVPSRQEATYLRYCEQGLSKTRHNFGLLRVSKQLNREVSHMLYSKTQYEVTDIGTLKDGAISRGLHLAIKHLRLTWDSFTLLCKMFMVRHSGVKLRDDDRKKYKHPSWIVQSMDLDTLELVMPEPRVERKDDGTEYQVCHKKVVHSILIGAWRYLRGHNVYITGYVKDWQKKDFERSCDIERERYLEWQNWRVAAGRSKGSAIRYAADCDPEDDEEDGGVRLDGKPKIPYVRPRAPMLDWDDEEALSDGWSPECECEVPCSLEEWQA